MGFDYDTISSSSMLNTYDEIGLFANTTGVTDVAFTTTNPENPAVEEYIYGRYTTFSNFGLKLTD